jgi:cell division protease FtsH
MNDNGPEKKGPEIGGKGGLSWGVILIVLLAVIFILPWITSGSAGAMSASEISYSSFRQQLERGNVKSVTVSGEKIQGILKNPIGVQAPGEQEANATSFVTYLPSFGDEQLLGLLEKQGVEVRTQPSSNGSWLTALVGLLPLVILIMIGFTLFRSMRSQGQDILSFAKSRARRYTPSRERVTFDDVAGVEGAKQELQEIVEFLKDPSRFRRLGARNPKGVLLVGAPGTGKTLLARAVAGEAGVPFYSIGGSDFMEMFVGVGASRVRHLFAEAKKSSPAIIFIDELDSVGRQRGAGLGGGHDEREQTLNQLLAEMDGFEQNESVIVMAATNRPDILDSALLRPGRFDRRVTVDLPTFQDRVEILQIHARGKPLASDVDMEQVSRNTPGFSGADLANLLNEAALIAVRRHADKIRQQMIDEARDRIIMGLERKNLVLTENDKKLLAYHEAGHAVVAALLPHTDPLHKVTIIPRGQAMGVTQQMPERDRFIYDKDYLTDRLAVMMGGRAAEELRMGTITSGAESDLKQATLLARKMVLDWGMSDSMEHVALGSGRKQVFLGEDIGQPREYSEETAREVDEEVKKILNQVYEQARSLLTTHGEALDRVAGQLIEREEITGSRVLELVGVRKEIEQPQVAAVRTEEDLAREL